MKKIASVLFSAVLGFGMLTGCGSTSSEDITVISREDGSGTRGAFVELFEIVEKNSEGKKIDMTTETADVTSSTGVVLTSVAGNENAIGYVSLGSLNDTVKPLKIDGVHAIVDNIKNGSYKISRPFNIATKGDVNTQTQDFINFIMSKQGQEIVEDKGYISKENTGEFKSNNSKGTVKVAGSSSVTPVMEKLKEAYEAVNSKVKIEVSQSDSTNGMNSVSDGICDIGMASRELKDSEIEKGLQNKVIALDGIVVVVNKNNPVGNMTADNVKDIYLGNTLSWSEFK